MGRAKKRLPLLIKLYKLLRENGINVLFEIVGAKESKRIYEDENFRYIKQISYNEYLERCSQAEFLLEVMQSASHSGYTTRVLEAISLGKKLMSNNTRLKDAPFYDKDMLSVFTSENDFDVSFVKKAVNPGWKYNDENYSAEALLEFLKGNVF